MLVRERAKMEVQRAQPQHTAESWSHRLERDCGHAHTHCLAVPSLTAYEPCKEE